MPTNKTREELFWAKVTRCGDWECWEWQAARDPKGYGRFGKSNHRAMLAHRFSYELLVGPIPEGLHLDHLCRNTSCVNPNHLEPVTHLENCRRGDQGLYLRERTHCIRGHEFTPENTGSQRGGTGRYCRACVNAAARAKRAAARSENR